MSIVPDRWLRRVRLLWLVVVCSAYSGGYITAGIVPRGTALQLGRLNSQAAASSTSLALSTFLGGSNFDQVYAVAVDGSGNIYVTGQTASSNFPSRIGGQDGNRDVFIAKLDPAGARFIYLTVLGGLQTDAPRGIAVDGSGNAYVTGYTTSADFPTTAGAYKTAASGNEDAFVLKLNPSGQLVYSTFLGGSGRDFATAVAIDGSGNAYVTGYTSSTNFPIVSGAFQGTNAGGAFDAFVTKLNATGTALLYSTFLGGLGDDTAFSIAIDTSGNAYICGETDSTNFPAIAGMQAAGAGGHDGFVAKFNASASALVFSTYLGGSLDDFANSIAVDSSQNVYVAGATASWDFPVSATAFQRSLGGGMFDAFLTKLSSSGSTILFSTLLGGSGSDQATALSIDSAGNAWLTGTTSSPNFPLVNSLQAQLAGGTDVFLTTVNGTGDQLLYSSYLGGGMDDSPLSISIDNKGAGVVGGLTASPGFPATAGVVQPIFGGSYDGFVSKIATGICPYNLSATVVNITSTGGSGSITATASSGCSAPTASSNAAWITVSVVGNSVNWTIAPNPSSLSRSGTLTISGQAVIVVQTGLPCSYVLNPASLSLNSTGGSGNITITPSPSDCGAATGSSNVSWASVSVSGATASWTVNANPSSLARGGNFTIGGRTVNITQTGAACSYGLSTNNISVGPAGGSGSISITPTPGDCAQTSASSNVGWASVSISGNTAPWTISANSGTQSRAGTFTIGGQSVAVNQASAAAPGTLTLNRSVLNFGTSGTLITSSQSVIVGFAGGSGVAWTVSSNQPNITVSPSGGTGAGSFTVTAAAGASGAVTVSAPGAAQSPQQVQVSVRSVTPGYPSGSFDTPINGSTGIAGAIPVTGWAIDNIEVTKVDIWREPRPDEPPGLAYIGDAVFVADARTDVEVTFPTMPMQYRAGWGYMMLTNFLPNNGGSPGPGNGTYALHALAHNKAGNSIDLGTRTITVDNAHATKPFGTIDTPGQGALAAGNAYVNFGWALTQNPYKIPTDGSTLTVFVDGLPVGHPIYNQYRADIANFFPGLANSNGAIGFFFIDTTALANGVHNIAWSVYDNQNRGDGIGSRYFTILNSGSVAAIEEPVAAKPGALELRRQNGRHIQPELLVPQNDVLDVEMEELERLELDVGATRGHLEVEGEQRPLPIGSSLKAGVFYWQAGPGFLGEYPLVFERADLPDLTLRVAIRPKRFP